MLPVVFALAALGSCLALSLVGPILVALLAGETAVASRLSVHLVVGAFVFGAPLLATMGRTRRPRPDQQLATLILGWALLPLLGSVVLADTTPLGLLDAMFESVSAFTTAGASVVQDVEILPQGIVFLRAQAQWIGGYLALLTVVLVLAPLGLGGLSARSATLSGGSLADLGADRLQWLLVRLGVVYLVMTGACFLALFLGGTRAFYAATLAMTAVSTGGILPFDGPVDTIVGSHGLFVMGVFLAIGATSVFWQRALLTGRWRLVTAHRESYLVMATVALLALVFALLLTSVPGASRSFAAVLSEALFNAASLVSTSGIESRPGLHTLLPLTVVLFLVLLGGSAFGTSGGLKHYRLGGMISRSWGELDRLIYPAIVRPSHFGSQNYDPALMRAIWAFFWAALLTVAAGTLAVAAAGVPFEASLTAAIAAFTTAGPVYEAGWTGSDDWPAYAALPGFAKIVLMALMVLGRLEVLAVLGLLVVLPGRH